MALLKMRENGILQYVFRKYDIPEQACPDRSGESLGYSTCISMFLPLCFGILSSLALFIMELTTSQFMKKRKIKIILAQKRNELNTLNSMLSMYQEQMYVLRRDQDTK